MTTKIIHVRHTFFGGPERSMDYEIPLEIEVVHVDDAPCGIVETLGDGVERRLPLIDGTLYRPLQEWGDSVDQMIWKVDRRGNGRQIEDARAPDWIRRSISWKRAGALQDVIVDVGGVVHAPTLPPMLTAFYSDGGIDVAIQPASGTLPDSSSMIYRSTDLSALEQDCASIGMLANDRRGYRHRLPRILIDAATDFDPFPSVVVRRAQALVDTLARKKPSAIPHAQLVIATRMREILEAIPASDDALIEVGAIDPVAFEHLLVDVGDPSWLADWHSSHGIVQDLYRARMLRESATELSAVGLSR